MRGSLPVWDCDRTYVISAFTRGNNKTSKHCNTRGKIRTIVMNACMTEGKRQIEFWVFCCGKFRKNPGDPWWKVTCFEGSVTQGLALVLSQLSTGTCTVKSCTGRMSMYLWNTVHTSSLFSKDSSLSFLLAKAALVYLCCVGRNKTYNRQNQSCYESVYQKLFFFHNS